MLVLYLMINVKYLTGIIFYMKYSKQRERDRERERKRERERERERREREREREREMGERNKRATIHVNVISSTLSCICDLPQVYFVYLKFDPIVFE